jgi:hypothetical protein
MGNPDRLKEIHASATTGGTSTEIDLFTGERSCGAVERT